MNDWNKPANGHANGNGHHRKELPESAIDLARELEKVGAERDSAMAAILALREAFCLQNGYQTPTQQRVLRDVEGLLESRGLIKVKRSEWTNRG